MPGVTIGTGLWAEDALGVELIAVGLREDVHGGDQGWLRAALVTAGGQEQRED
jgi:hypothetical protein